MMNLRFKLIIFAVPMSIFLWGLLVISVQANGFPLH